MIKKTIIITFFALLLILSLVNAVKPSVNQNNMIIEANQETYYCTQVYSMEGCLFTGYVTITNNNVGAKSFDLGMDFNKNIRPRNSGNQFNNANTGRNYKATGKNTLLLSGQSIVVPFEFYASESGKFNYTLDLGGGLITTLDPFFNITTNGTPSIYYYGSTQDLVSDDIFPNSTVITSDLSDGNDGTKYLVSEITDAQHYWSFEENTGTTTEDVTINTNDGTLNNGVLWTNSKGDRGTGTYALDFDGNNDYVSLTSTVGGFNSVSFWVNQGTKVGFDYYFAHDNFRVYDDNADGELKFGDSIGGLLDSDIVMSSKGWTHIVAISDGVNSKLYVDGVNIVNGTIEAVATNTINLGRWTGGTHYFAGQMDEVAIFNRVLTQSEITDIYDSGLSEHAVIKATFDVTINASQNNWLRVRKTTSGLATAKVYRYENDTGINLSSFDTHIINTGWDNIPLVNSTIDHDNLTIRFYTSEPSEISEIQLITQIEDNTNPSIINCQVNNTNLGCDDFVRLSCNVTDEYLHEVDFGFDDNSKNLEQADRILNTDIFFFDKQYTSFTSGITEVYNFTNATAIDIVDNTNLTLLTESYNYTCNACSEIWVAQFTNITSCTINNTIQTLKFYTDSNACGTNTTLPSDNGTITEDTCNYCSADLVEPPTFSACIDNEHTRTYTDLNLASCCQVTNLTSDCPTLFDPLYTPNNFTCGIENLTTDFTANCDAEPIITDQILQDDRIECFIDLNSTDVYDCITYVRQNITYLQTNPQKTDFNDPFISLKNRMEESRSFFTTQNGLANVYYTSTNLIADGEFVLGIKCNSATDSQTYEQFITPTYEDLNIVNARTFWIKDNMAFILIGLVLGFAFLGLIGIAISKVFR